jgi:hypothetical protein
MMIQGKQIFNFGSMLNFEIVTIMKTSNESNSNLKIEIVSAVLGKFRNIKSFGTVDESIG